MKDWLIEVGLKKLGPSAIRATLAALTGVILAHSNSLSALGIGYDNTTDTIVWHLTTARAWMGTVGLGLLASGFMAVQHHLGAAVSGAPQTGGTK